MECEYACLCGGCPASECASGGNQWRNIHEMLLKLEQVAVCVCLIYSELIFGFLFVFVFVLMFPPPKGVCACVCMCVLNLHSVSTCHFCNCCDQMYW